MKNKIFYSILITFILGCSNVFAQEALQNLQINPQIKSLYSNKKESKTVQEKSSLELPFIDDFAKATGYPDSSLWIDQYAYVNFTYPIEPYSIGVATLDAINSDGSIYPDANSITFGADTLTSKPIDLNYPGDNTIFLSFFYQPGGLGDAPDLKDSLILEYYAPDSARWNKAWYVIFNKKDSLLTEYFAYNQNTKSVYGDTTTDLSKTFHNVIVPVQEEQYLKTEFQFRFRNRASLSTTDDSESKASNCDHWHLDYVILDKDRNINDTIVNDAAFKYPLGSMIKYYQSMPWTHFRYVTPSIMIDTFSITYINNSDDIWNLNYKFFSIDRLGNLGSEEMFISGTGDDIPPFETHEYKRYNDYSFPYSSSNDSALFEVASYLTSDSDPLTAPYRWNDTTRFYQKFYNYYAFDDGSAENGYGIIGEGTEYAMVAMNYQTFVKDTLRGVQMYFNQTLNDANQYTFRIHVWSELNGKPGSILYTQEGVKPKNADELNKFTTYTFDDYIVLDGDFFIGWQKVNTSEMLNVGFDVNHVNNDKLYYNFSGEWIQSQLQGTVMIRPMFGHEVITSVPENPVIKPVEFYIYPNPASTQLNITIDDQLLDEYRYSIFNTYGRIFKDSVYSDSSIDISNLNSGIYFIRITSSTGKSSTKKFIVIH